MNNALDLTLNYIKNNIPAQILETAFVSRKPGQQTYPIEHMILQKVIRGIVRKHTNTLGGKQKKIVLLPQYQQDLKFNEADAFMYTGPFSLYRIPPEQRQGQSIVDVSGLTYRGSYSGYVPHANGWAGGANLNTLGAGVIDSHTFASSPPRPDVTLLSGDLVRLAPSQHSTIIWVLSCRIGYDQDFTNLNQQAVLPFCQLCLTATKMYIYNKLIIPIDKAFIESGYEINAYKTIVDSYADSQQKFKEQLDAFCGTALMDPDNIRQLLPYLL